MRTGVAGKGTTLTHALAYTPCLLTTAGSLLGVKVRRRASHHHHLLLSIVRPLSWSWTVGL